MKGFETGVAAGMSSAMAAVRHRAGDDAPKRVLDGERRREEWIYGKTGPGPRRSITPST